MSNSRFMMVMLSGSGSCSIVRVWSDEFLTELAELAPMLREGTRLETNCSEVWPGEDWGYTCT